MNTDLASYYKQRAAEYENIYQKPERQNDLEEISSVLLDIFRRKDIIEICCGTGYWTQRIAKTSNSISASDINETVIEIARQKTYGPATVSFSVEDFYSYVDDKLYDGLFGGFIWSHIQLQDLHAFLAKTTRFVRPGGKIVFIDNNYLEGNSTAIALTDERGNTFQERMLADGSRHLVRKNFPSREFIFEKLKMIGDDIEFLNFQYYWLIKFRPLK
jgi:SAM-dependent methyltransferase